MSDLSKIDNAITKIRSGSFDDGREILEKVILEEPDRTDALYYLGLCYSELGMVEKAVSVLETCIRQDPQYGDAYAALGTSLMLGKRYKEASEKFKVALTFDPDNFFALANLGAVYVELGRFDETIRYLKRANRLFPDRPQVLLGLALAYELKGELDRAEPYYRRVLATQQSGEPFNIARNALERIEDFRLFDDEADELEPNVDLVMFCLDALRKFRNRSRQDIREIGNEIAAQVTQKLWHPFEIEDTADEAVYELNSISGSYTGLQLMCYMYVAFRLVEDSEIDIGDDLEEEYEIARHLFHKRYGEA